MEAPLDADIRSRLETWIAGRRPDPTFGGGAVSAAGHEGHLRHILAVARLIAEGIGATLPGVQVKDATKYDFISSILSEILGFSDFSLAEYTYSTKDGSVPGVRLRLDQYDGEPRLSVIAFEDVVQWRVSQDGQKLSSLLLVLAPRQDEIVALVPSDMAEDLGAAPESWQVLLLEAMLTPLKGSRSHR